MAKYIFSSPGVRVPGTKDRFFKVGEEAKFKTEEEAERLAAKGVITKVQEAKPKKETKAPKSEE